MKKLPMEWGRDFGWCLNGHSQWPQCQWCKRNKHRYEFPRGGDLLVHVMSKASLAAAAKAQCHAYIDDTEVRKEHDLRERRHKAMLWTTCRGCKHTNFKDDGDVPYCFCVGAFHFKHACPRTRCDRFEAWTSDKGYQRRTAKWQKKTGEGIFCLLEQVEKDLEERGEGDDA